MSVDNTDLRSRHGHRCPSYSQDLWLETGRTSTDHIPMYVPLKQLAAER